MGAACRAVNKALASSRDASADSVMRSCSKAATWAKASALRALVPPSSPVLSCSWYSVMRSTRLTAKPQLCAMSVALDAQGDTVPKRGLTTMTGPPAVAVVASKGSP